MRNGIESEGFTLNRKWIQLIIISALVAMLAGCGKSVEEQISQGVASAQTTFENTALEPTKKVGKINVYVPSGYSVEKGANEMNYIFTKGKDSFILFVNTIEAEDSKLHYENLLEDKEKEVVKKQTFEFDEAFGFTAVVKHSEEQYELVVSSGGVKMTTLSEDKNIDDKLAGMMQIVRSVKVN